MRDALFIDLEGTLYFRGAPVPGAIDAVRRLRSDGWVLRFLTNTDSKTTLTIAKDLARMGFSIDAAEIFTPVSALIEYGSLHPGKRFHLLLSSELRQYVSAHLESTENEVSYVVIGDVRECCDYSTLNAAFKLVMAGAEVLALQKGRYFVREDGYNLDTGAFVSLLEYASGKKARVLGKPDFNFFELALSSVQRKPDHVVVVGDDLATDITGARGIGCYSIMVKTGKFKQEDLESSTVRPDAIADSIGNVPEIMRGLR